jgi:hypothetical protein
MQLATNTYSSEAGLPADIALDQRLVERLMLEGYADVCVRRGQVCAVGRFNFTTAVVVGLSSAGYDRRYCYEHRADAQAALARWDGAGHPSGPWIKCKGAGIDLLNPEFV